MNAKCVKIMFCSLGSGKNSILFYLFTLIVTNPLIFLDIFMIDIFVNNKLIQGLDFRGNYFKVSSGFFSTEQLNIGKKTVISY